MKIFFVCLMTLFSMICSANEQVISIPHQESFDSYWKLVDERIDSDEAFQEWIPANETAENWTKSFGIQRYQLKKDYDLDHFYKLFVETLSKDFEGYQEKFHHELISKDDNHLIFNWWCDTNDYEIGHEWVHVLKESSHKVVFVRFATKNAKESEEDNMWRDCILDVAYSELIPPAA